MSTVANELLSPQRWHGVTLDEALSPVESQVLPAGRGQDGGVYVREDDLREYEQADF